MSSSLATKMVSDPRVITLIVLVASVLGFVLRIRRLRRARLTVIRRTSTQDDDLSQAVDRTVHRLSTTPKQPILILQDMIAFPPRPFNPPNVPHPGWMARWTGSNWTESANFVHLLDADSKPITLEGPYREPFDDPNFPFGGFRPQTPPLKFPALPSNPRTEAWIDDQKNPLPPSPPLEPVGMTNSVGSPLQWGGRELLQRPSYGIPMAIPLAPGAPNPFASQLPSPVPSARSSSSISSPAVSVQDVAASPVSESSSSPDYGFSAYSYDAETDFAWSD